MQDRIISCPGCGKSSVYNTSNPYRPFCSRSCSSQDTINWCDENYRLAGPVVLEEEINGTEFAQQATALNPIGISIIRED